MASAGPTRAFRRLQNAALGTVAAFLRKGDPSRWPIDPKLVSSILIIRPDKLGDMILTTPLFHYLRSHLPRVRIEVVASAVNYEIAINNPHIDEVHLYTSGVWSPLRLISHLRRRRFDVVYDPMCHDSVRGLMISHLVGGKAVLAAARKQRWQEYYDYCRKYQPDGDDHNLDNALLLLEVLGLDLAEVDPLVPLPIPTRAEAIADEFLGGLPEDDQHLVGVNLSAGGESRRLDSETYAATIKLLARHHHDCRFVLLSTPEDRQRAEDIQAQIPSLTALPPTDLTLLAVAAIVQRLDILISPDTSLVHIARLSRVPVVGLYLNHPRNLAFWRPYGQSQGVVVAPSADSLSAVRPEQIVAEFSRVMAAQAHVPTVRSN